MSESIPEFFYRISAKALILNEEKKFLLTRKDTDLWELPGAKLGFGDSGPEGIRKALKAEMGIDIISVNPHPSYFLTVKNMNGIWIANIIYKTEIDPKQLNHIPTNKECKEVQFFNKIGAGALYLYPNGKEFLRLFDPEDW